MRIINLVTNQESLTKKPGLESLGTCSDDIGDLSEPNDDVMLPWKPIVESTNQPTSDGHLEIIPLQAESVIRAQGGAEQATLKENCTAI